MFSDHEWDSSVSDKQENRFQDFLGRNEDKKICIIEIGAGTGIPSIRYKSEHIFEYYENIDLIRINLNEPDGPEGCYSIQDSALSALSKLFDS